ncbi:hypothetical protein F7725_025327, partial [Dissostichus mawsoni]
MERQQGDPELDMVRQLINQGLNVSQVRRSECPQVHGWLQTWGRLELHDGILGRCIQEPDTGQQAFQLIVPTQHARELWEDYHKAAGHANSEKVLSILQRRFYWLGMAKDINRVRAHTKQRQNWDQARYDKKAHAIPLLPGGRVLFRNFRRRARGKLEPHWVPSPYVRPGHPVYSIRPEGKEGPIRTMHRNNLRPCPAGLWTESQVCPQEIDSQPKQPVFLLPFAPVARWNSRPTPVIPGLVPEPEQLGELEQVPAQLDPEPQLEGGFARGGTEPCEKVAASKFWGASTK